MGEDDHSALQGAICQWFQQHRVEWNIRVRPELRVQVKAKNYLVPDVTILDAANPKEKIATLAPLAVFEVWSPENKMRDMRKKLFLYEQMGIPQIWLIDPEDRSEDGPEKGIWQRFENGKLAPANTFSLPERGIRFEMAEIDKLVQ